jgi:hypothetical protein
MAVMLVLALATIGVVFGLWSKVLTIDGTVETGNVDGVWFAAACSENPFDVPPGEFEGKDVGSVTVAPHPSDQEILIVTVENAYPSYEIDCQVHFANNGSIPFKIRGISGPTPDPAPDISVGLSDGIDQQLEPCGFTPTFPTSPLLVPDNCEAAMSLVLHVEQSAEQNAGRGQAGDPPAYQFQFKVCVAQWNEPATSAQCFAAP